MYLRISYFDIFNNERHTYYCAFVDPTSIQRDASGNITGMGPK